MKNCYSRAEHTIYPSNNMYNDSRKKLQVKPNHSSPIHFSAATILKSCQTPENFSNRPRQPLSRTRWHQSCAVFEAETMLFDPTLEYWTHAQRSPTQCSTISPKPYLVRECQTVRYCLHPPI